MKSYSLHSQRSRDGKIHTNVHGVTVIFMEAFRGSLVRICLTGKPWGRGKRKFCSCWDLAFLPMSKGSNNSISNFKKKIIYLFLFFDVLGLHCCVGFSLVVVWRLLIAVPSLVAEHRLYGLNLFTNLVSKPHTNLSFIISVLKVDSVWVLNKLKTFNIPKKNLKENGYLYVYNWNHFVVQLKRIQCCQSTTLQYKIKRLFFFLKFYIPRVAKSWAWLKQLSTLMHAWTCVFKSLEIRDFWFNKMSSLKVNLF